MKCIDVEIELDEFFYHLVSVKDALLHEINRDFKLHIKLRGYDWYNIYKTRTKEGSDYCKYYDGRHK